MTDAYKVGITVALTNVMSAELLKIIGQLGSADAAAMGFAGKLGLVAGAVALVGAALEAGVKEAAKFQIEATKFASLGFGDSVNLQAKKFAIGMDTLGTSATENMALVSDAMAVFKNIDHAQMAAPLMAKMKFANEAVFGGEQGGANDKKFMDMLKVIEFRGGLANDNEFQTQADFVQKVISGSRNRVDASQLLMALKTGGVSLARLGNDAFYLGSEPLIQEFGGSRYGTANMSAYQNLVMMRTTQQALTEMMRLGLLDSSKVEMNKFTGKVKRASPGAFKGADVLEQEGDLSFLEKVLLPAFANKGITSDEAVIQEIGRLFTNRTASGLFSRIYQQRGILHTQMDANRSAMGIDGLTKAADATLDGKRIEIHKQYDDLMRELGNELLPHVVTGLGGLVAVMRGLNNFLKMLPEGWLGSAASKATALVPGIGPAFNIFSGLGGSVNAVPPPANQNAVVVDHKTFLDGKVLAESTTKYQVQGLASVGNSGNNYDLRMTPMQLGH